MGVQEKSLVWPTLLIPRKSPNLLKRLVSAHNQLAFFLHSMISKPPASEWFLMGTKSHVVDFEWVLSLTLLQNCFFMGFWQVTSLVVVAGDFWYDEWRCLVQLRVYWQKWCCHVRPGINTAGLYQQPTTSLSSDECLWTSNLTNSEKIGKSNLCLCVSACVHTRTSWLIGNVEELQAGGVAVILGLAADKDNVTFHPSTLLYGRTWTSGLFGGYKGRTDLPGLVEKYMDGVWDQNPSFFSHKS